MTNTGLKILFSILVFTALLPATSYAQTKSVKKPENQEPTKQVEKRAPKKTKTEKPATNSEKINDMFSRAQDEIAKGKVCGEKPQPVS